MDESTLQVIDSTNMRFSELVLCLGARIAAYPLSVKSWTDKIECFTHSTPHRELDRIDGEPVAFELDPGHTTLKLLSELQNTMEKERSVLPKDFMDRTIFMFVYSDTDWIQEDNGEICNRHSSMVAEYAKDLSNGHWSFLGPGTGENGILRSPLN